MHRFKFKCINNNNKTNRFNNTNSFNSSNSINNSSSNTCNVKICSNSNSLDPYSSNKNNPFNRNNSNCSSSNYLHKTNDIRCNNNNNSHKCNSSRPKKPHKCCLNLASSSNSNKMTQERKRSTPANLSVVLRTPPLSAIWPTDSRPLGSFLRNSLRTIPNRTPMETGLVTIVTPITMPMKAWLVEKATMGPT